ncbi:hypothetical protein IAT38_001108 [Cryptococcus sp. DSM 104549]
MTSNVLPLFWPLANSSKETRLNASSSLVSSLENFQQTFAQSRKAGSSKGKEVESDAEDEEEDDSEDEESGMEVDASDDEGADGEVDAQAQRLDRQLSKDNAEDVVYTVKRLVRGLASSRESSRLGFAVALTELLSRIQSVTARQVFSLVIRNSPFSRNMKGSDERDGMFARLFGMTAIVQSGALFAPSASKEDFRGVVEQLVTLGQAKAWMRESAWWTLVGAVEGLVESNVEWKDEALEEVVALVFEEKGWTQEKVALVLKLENKSVAVDWKTYLAPTFKHTPLLHSNNLATLGRVLKETTGEDDDSISASTTGSWKPQLHFVWTIILEHYFPKSKAAAPSTSEAPFQDFFRAVVDESLFSNASSPQRRYWGFQVFERALPLLPPSQMPLIFTPNFMRCWMNNLSSSDRYLHKAALQIAKRVQEVIKENPKVGFTLLSQLVGKHGRPDFDKVTKTKTVESIMGSLNAEGVKDFVTYLQEVVLGTAQDNTNAASIDERRLWALDQIQALCRNGSVPKDDAWISSVLDFLFVHGFFLIRSVDKKNPITALHATPKPALSEATSAACRARFISCIVELTTASISRRGADEAKNTRQQGCDASGKPWLRRALETVAALEGDKKHVELMTDADDEIKKIRKEAVKTLAGLKKAKETQKDIARGLEILISFFALQTYDEVDDALDNLEEVNSAAQKIFGLGKGLPEDEDVPPVDALLDVLIALLDKGSSDLRNLANLVFGMVASEFTESSLALLSAQLEQTVASAAAAEGEDDEGSDDEDDDEEASGDEDDASSAEEEEEDEDEDDMGDVDPAFRQRVADALGLGAVDDEDADSDAESEHWDDEQMLKVDEQLASVFRERAATSKRTDLKHLQIESLHFKNRILDFYDTYAKRQITNPLVLPVVLTLLRLVRAAGTSEAELANKAAGILRGKFNKPKDVPSTADIPKANATLLAIHAMAQKAHSAEFSNLCGLCSLFVSRAIDASSPTSTEVVDAYRATLKDFMTRKASLIHPPFITEFIKRFPARAFALHSDLAGYVAPGAAVNTYRQLQGYTMLQLLAQQLPNISKTAPAEEVAGFITASCERVFATLEAAADDAEGSGKEGWNAQKLKDVVKFALQLARNSKAVGVEWDVKRVEAVGEKVKSGERTKEMKGVQSMWTQLEGILSKKEGKGKKAAGKGKGKAEESEKMDVDGEEVEAEAAEKAEAKAEKKVKKAKKVAADAPVEGEKPKKRKSVDGEAKKKKKSKAEASS